MSGAKGAVRAGEHDGSSGSGGQLLNQARRRRSRGPGIATTMMRDIVADDSRISYADDTKGYTRADVATDDPSRVRNKLDGSKPLAAMTRGFIIAVP